MKCKVTEGVGSRLEPCCSWFGLHLKISGKSLELFKLVDIGLISLAFGCGVGSGSDACFWDLPKE